MDFYALKLRQLQKIYWKILIHEHLIRWPGSEYEQGLNIKHCIAYESFSCRPNV